MPGAHPDARVRAHRARRIGTTFGRIYLGLRARRFLARRVNPPDMPERWRRFHRHSAGLIYEAAVELQGLILKGCQFLGARADVLPREYVEILSRLQDRVPPRPFPVVRASVERELGADLEQIFASFETSPIASASLAQVHAARLHSGERVAVKVQYPEIESLVRSDLANLRTLFRAVGLLEGDFDLMPLVDELATHVPRELNFVQEAHNAETIGRHFKDRDDVAVPRIHWEFTTRRVLVMEYIDGIKITDLAALRRAGLDPAQVSQLLVEAYCEQILRHGFFHADPHPGNLLVQRRESGGPRLVFVDFGLAKELPPSFRQGAVEFAAALLRGEPAAMAEALVALGFETRDGRPESLVEIAGFVLEAAQRFRHGVRLEPASGRVFREIPDLIRENPIVRVPSHLVLLGRVLGLLSGVNRSLDARIDLARTIFPYVMGVAPRPGGPSGS
jgi:predicted unusual protein kinase regulating ubiquinone biosynthesis (AarF/ABC1/UbiB family)